MAPPRPRGARWTALAACAAARGAGAQDHKDPTKACDRFFPKPVETLCHERFPGEDDEKLWLVLFTSHACPECSAVKDRFVQLAKELEDDPGVAVGAVDCFWRVNYKGLCHPRHSVDAVPSLRIVQRGKLNMTEKKDMRKRKYPRHDWEAIERLVQAQLQQRPACPSASLAAPGRVAPLCEGRYPAAGGAARDWLVAFYARAGPGAGRLLTAFGEVSLHLGNGPGAESGGHWAGMKKLDRLLAIENQYGLRVALPAEGPFGFGSLAKVGAVCCDCDDAQAAFCARTLGGGEAPALPLAVVVRGGRHAAVEAPGETAASVMEFALSGLGFLDAGGEL